MKLHESYSNLRAILSNYLVCAYYAERHDVYPLTIEQIESFPAENASDQADTFLVAKGARLVYLLNTPDKSGSEKLIKEIESGLKKFQAQLPIDQVIYINMNICLLRFQTQNYSQLVSSLNDAFTFIGRDEKRYHFILMLKFLEIMAHFSLKNYGLLDCQLRNTERWLREHELNEVFTDVLLKSFSAMRTDPQYSQIKNQLKALDCSNGLQTLKKLVLEWMDVNTPSGTSMKAKEQVSVSQSVQHIRR